MSKTIVLVCTMLVTLVLTMAAPVSKQGLSPRPVQAQSLDLTVTVDCESIPETTRVENNGSRTITIETVGSIYQPRSDETFAVDAPLGTGRSITFESGSGANQNRLTGEFVYNNDVGSEEGAEVTTSTGERFIDRCGTGPTQSQRPNPPAGGGAQSSAAEQQYRGETIIRIPTKKRLPPTGGPPRLGVFAAAGLLGAGLLVLRERSIAVD